MPRGTTIELNEVKKELPDQFFVNVTTCDYPDNPDGSGTRVISATGPTERDALEKAKIFRENHWAKHKMKGRTPCNAILSDISLISPKT